MTICGNHLVAMPATMTVTVMAGLVPCERCGMLRNFEINHLLPLGPEELLGEVYHTAGLREDGLCDDCSKEDGRRQAVENSIRDAITQ